MNFNFLQMKTFYLIMAMFTGFIYVYPVYAQFDDLYFDRNKARKSQKEKVVEIREDEKANKSDYSGENQDYYGYEFDEESEYYSDYDYAYTTRIRRFHRPQPPLRYYTSFDYWYNDFYYDPFFDNNINVNVFIGSPVFGWNRWNRWNSWNSWGHWNRWNRWNQWDVWAFNDPWGWNSWGWNSWNYCPPTYGYWGGNVFYTNVYNNYYNGGTNVGGNNGGWGNNGSVTRVINQSRRDGGLVSSPTGRGTTRRVTNTGTNPTTGKNPGLTNDRVGEANNHTTPRATQRVYKGDIKNPSTPGVTNPGTDTRRQDGTNPETGKNIGTTRNPVDRKRENTSTVPSIRREATRTEPDRDRSRPSAPTKRDDNRKTEPDRSKTPDRVRDHDKRTNKPTDTRRQDDNSRSKRDDNSNRSGGGFESSSSRSSSTGPSDNQTRSSSSRSGGGFESSSPKNSSSRSGGGFKSSGSSRSSGGSMQSGSSRSSSGGGMQSGGSSRSSSGSSSSGRSGGSSRGGGRN